mmetsp:Transcript_15360/g.33112  ORF Transcript_15360/g.33112 Transcript_15360/m.33112 type:complete len:282 (-) Transcript_15360:33-878(-)
MLPNTVTYMHHAVTSVVDLNPGVLFYNLFQLIGICALYKGEMEKPMPYSKFAAESPSAANSAAMIPSRTGMLIIYVPATIVAFIFQYLLPQFASIAFTPTIAGWMVLAHFLKRDAEVLFLHKYSGETDSNAAKIISVSYALTSFVICLLSNPKVSVVGSSDIQLGLLFFVMGSLGNFYHHYLLSLLRPDSSSDKISAPGKKKYSAPTGGLFEYVAAPHYFFELIVWLGIALVSQQLTSYLNFVSMCCYLSARSYNQNQWNQNKFGEKEWPSSRKNLIPFLY